MRGHAEREPRCRAVCGQPATTRSFGPRPGAMDPAQTTGDVGAAAYPAHVAAVFISSLARGPMAAFREAARDAVDSLGMRPVMFETEPASTQDSRRALLDRIPQRDALLLILGAEYGEAAARGVSPTEEEFQEAVRHGVPVLAIVQEGIEREPARQEFIDGGRGTWEEARLPRPAPHRAARGPRIVGRRQPAPRGTSLALRRRGRRAGGIAVEREAAVELANEFHDMVRGDDALGTQYGDLVSALTSLLPATIERGGAAVVNGSPTPRWQPTVRPRSAPSGPP